MTKEEAKSKFNVYKCKADNWYHKNKKWIEPVFSAIIVGGPLILRFTSKRANLVKEQKLKDNYIYDRSHGHYWELRRKLSTRELMEIDKRKDKGESLVDILESMRVLK